MLTVAEMIERIRQSPGIVAGSSVRALYGFLTGFAYARKDTGADDYADLADFRDYVRDRYAVTSTQSWAQIIEFFSVSEPEEMKLFWKLWDEYAMTRVKENKERSRSAGGNGEKGNGPVPRRKRRTHGRKV